MAKKKSNDVLSRRERQIMDVVFELGEATVTEVMATMQNPPTRTTIRTLMRIMEEKGHLKHRTKGREFIYRPIKTRKKAGQNAIKRVVQTFFEGSLQQAVAAHLSDPQASLDQDELQALEQLIQDAKQNKVPSDQTRSKERKSQ